MVDLKNNNNWCKFKLLRMALMFMFQYDMTNSQITLLIWISVMILIKLALLQIWHLY